MLETARCKLRAPKEGDIPTLVGIYTDPAVRKFLGGPQSELEVTPKITARVESPGTYWVVVTTHDEKVIGDVCLDPHHDGNDTEISYQFSPSSWGQGFATEVARCVLDYAMNELNLPCVVAETQVANRPSCRLLERLGMKLDREVQRFGERQAIYKYRARAA